LETKLPRVLVGEGESEGWILVWHQDRDGRLRESRFRATELPDLLERLLALHLGGSGGS
jgi:hypothetical protein